MKMRRSLLLLSIFAISFAASSTGLRAQDNGPAAVTIPFVFANTVDAAKSHNGDAVTGRTIQAVTLADGSLLPKGSEVRGHITKVRAFSFDPAPYAKQQPSILAIHFDEVSTKTGNKKINASVRAIADRFAADEASSPHYQDDTDHVGTMELIGGGSYSPLSKEIVTGDEDIIGYNRKGMVFARLMSSGQCDASGGEQSVAIFSPMACGVYGFDGLSMPDNGSASNSGTFRLEQRHHNARVAAHSAALLELMPTSAQNATRSAAGTDAIPGR